MGLVPARHLQDRGLDLDEVELGKMRPQRLDDRGTLNQEWPPLGVTGRVPERWPPVHRRPCRRRKACENRWRTRPGSVCCGPRSRKSGLIPGPEAAPPQANRETTFAKVIAAADRKG